MAYDKLERLTYDDAMMLDKLVDTVNMLMDAIEYLDKRMDRHWKMHRMQEREENKKI